MAVWTGWLAVAAIVLAVLVPTAQRIRTGQRGAPGSRPIRIHVYVGMATAALAFTHTLVIIPSLGSPAAISGGVAAMMAAGAAFFLLVAHAGLGLQLREPKLKDRKKKRRMHTTTALLIALAVTAHVVLLRRGS